MSHAISIDLETASTRANAAIASIGAVRFDPRGNWLGDTLHIHVSLRNCQHHGLAIDADTFIWWLMQGEDARVALFAGQTDAAPLITALEALGDFIENTGEAPEIWVNGASFDLPILASAYRAADLRQPWRYWQERDLRTIKALNQGARLERQGTHHNALDDACHQARLIQHILAFNPDMDA
jgi:DNA polymerase III epsilon subunit-like protein